MRRAEGSRHAGDKRRQHERQSSGSHDPAQSRDRAGAAAHTSSGRIAGNPPRDHPICRKSGGWPARGRAGSRTARAWTPGISFATSPVDVSQRRQARGISMTTMKAVVFKGKDCLAVEEVPRPTPGAGEAVIRITATTICGTDVHIVRGEYPVKSGLILGHEPVGVIEELGAGLDRLYAVGQRVIV